MNERWSNLYLIEAKFNFLSLKIHTHGMGMSLLPTISSEKKVIREGHSQRMRDLLKMFLNTK